MKDKTLLNVAGIISLVLGILSCFTIVGALVGIPMIIGGNKLKKYSQMTDAEIYKEKDNLLVWSIVLCFLCTISGALGLVYYFSMDNSFNFNFGSKNSTKYSDLEKLNNLYQNKVITKEEFEKEKSRILNK